MIEDSKRVFARDFGLGIIYILLQSEFGHCT